MMSNMFQSAVFKLTTVFVSIVMSICILFSAALYHVAVQELDNGFTKQYTQWFNTFRPFGLRQPDAPTQEIASRSHHILIEIIYFNSLVLIITGVASYLLARRTLQPIQKSHEGQKRFTADVSHELRTPLTAMRMETEVALLNPMSSPRVLRDALSSNLEEVERMESLVNNLLLLSTMEAEQLRTVFKRINLKAIVQDSIHNVSLFAEKRNITIVYKADDRSVIGDASSLTQLFTILLENAVKYSPADSTINVSMRTGRARVAIDIKDRGPGIPPDALPFVFERFYRADSARTKDAGDEKQQSFGLGLSIAKLIADLHNGEIIITSTAGAGTNARVILPKSAKA